MAAAEKTNYSDSELIEFKELIERKLVEARIELKDYQDQILKKIQDLQTRTTSLMAWKIVRY